MTDVSERGISAIPGVMDVYVGLMTGMPNRAEMQKKRRFLQMSVQPKIKGRQQA